MWLTKNLQLDYKLRVLLYDLLKECKRSYTVHTFFQSNIFIILKFLIE